MRGLILLLLILTPVAVLLGTRLYGPHQGPHCSPLRSLTLLELFEVQEQERVRADRLAARRESLLASLQGKQRAAAKVVEGSMDLLTAAAVFRRLQAKIPDYDQEEFRRAYPADTDDERHCLALIHYVNEHLKDLETLSPAGRTDLVGALRAELKSRKESGTLRLPGPRPICVPPSNHE